MATTVDSAGNITIDGKPVGNINNQELVDAINAGTFTGGGQVGSEDEGFEGQGGGSIPEQINAIIAAAKAGTLPPQEALSLLTALYGDPASAQTVLEQNGVLPKSGLEGPIATPSAGGGIGAQLVPKAGIVKVPEAGTTITGQPGAIQAQINPSLLQESFPGRVFGGFVEPGLRGLSSVGQTAIQNLQGPAFASFLLGAQPSAFGPENTGGGFRGFLQSGQSILGPQGQAQGFTNLANQLAETQDAATPQSNFFSGNKRVFDLALQAGLPFVNPLFRQSFQDAALRQFEAFQFATPGQSFLQQLGSQGGRFF